MTLEETQQRILTSDEFVLEETKKLQVLYTMKRVIRYHQDRREPLDTESVAEHVYAAQVLAQYFLPLEDPEGKLDRLRILEMLLVHDISEIGTGDIVGWMKTTADREEEARQQAAVLATLPNTIQKHYQTLLTEYEERQTKEAKFAKAVEKMDPFFHLYMPERKQIMHDLESTPE
ncbi:MAG: HD domain-containing protein, partial [Candidatus Paceibacterota bacterium]